MPGMGMGLGLAMPVAGGANWLLPGNPDVDMDFMKGWYYGRSPGNIEVTRSSTALYEDSNNVWSAAGNNVLTLSDLGVRMDTSVTNWHPNPNNTGGSDGSPGVPPDNWRISQGNVNGLTRTLTRGTEDGLPYLDMRIAGTATANTNYEVYWFPSVAASRTAIVSEVYVSSMFAKVAAGSWAGCDVRYMVVREYNGAGAYLDGSFAGVTIPIGGSLGASRVFNSRTIAQATVARTEGNFQFTVLNGSTVDVTVRMAVPQIERIASGNALVPSAPILEGVGARAASLFKLLNIPFGSAYTILMKARSAGNTGSSLNGIVEANDGTAANRFNLRRISNLPSVGASGGTGISATSPAGTWAQNASGVTIFALAAGDQAAQFAANAPTAFAAATLPPGLDEIWLGGYAAGSFTVNSPTWLERLAVWTNRRVANSEFPAINAAAAL
jgi:hypothetical protein